MADISPIMMICLQARRQSPAGLAEPARFGSFGPFGVVRVVRGRSGRSGPFGHIAAPPAVADNTLTIKQKSTLPVGKTRQDESSFRSLSDTYLPPAMRRDCPPHLLLLPPPRAAPDAKTSLAYTTGPFSAPHCPARPSRTTEGLILYVAVVPAVTGLPLAHC